MIDGRTIGHGTAYSLKGTTLTYKVIRPAGGALAATLLSAELVRWARTTDHHHALVPARVSPDEYKRSVFACGALKAAILYVRVGQAGVAIGQSAAGRVLAVSTFALLPDDDRSAVIGLLAVDPENMGHHREYPTYRGVGTGMVAALAYELLQAGAYEILIKPLDAPAEKFWRARGFHEKPSRMGYLDRGGFGLSLWVVGDVEIRNLIRNCEIHPDCPDRDDCVACNAVPPPSTTRAAATAPRAPGKVVNTELWVHRDYVDRIKQRDDGYLWDTNKIAMAARFLPKTWRYNVVKMHKAGRTVSFIQSPDFDTANEPAVKASLSVDSVDGTTTRYGAPIDPYIYHHKWLMVGDDYMGFDVTGAKDRSRRWQEASKRVPLDKTRMGKRSFWENWLAQAGIPE